MKRYILILLVLSCTAFSQNPKPAPAAPLLVDRDDLVSTVNIMSLASSEGSTVIHVGDADPKLIEVLNAKGDVTLLVMRDGSIAKSAMLLDAQAKEFWRLMAKYAIICEATKSK